MNIGNVGRWDTLTVVCGWRIPLGTLTIRKSDTRKTPKKGYEESPYQSANMTTTYKPYSHVGPSINLQEKKKQLIKTANSARA